jgi:hypothetical protein
MKCVCILPYEFLLAVVDELRLTPAAAEHDLLAAKEAGRWLIPSIHTAVAINEPEAPSFLWILQISAAEAQINREFLSAIDR